jgi:ribosome-associated protein
LRWSSNAGYIISKIYMARWSWLNATISDIIWQEVTAFLEAEEIARLATELASEKQARDVTMLDVRALCSFADYFVICTGDTKRHIEAIWQGIDEVLKTKGVLRHHNEGTPDSGWMLGDFGSVIVHIFAPLERNYYQLDKLWDKATPVVRIQ